MSIQTVRGFRDILPEEAAKWQVAEEVARNTLHLFGFKEVRNPILEKTELFVRSIGETTDIVEKEMYSFVDKGGENLTLRPEATASMARMFIQYSLYHRPTSNKLFTIGPMFRRERPQKGRYRQFWQINAEMFGFAHPAADAEIIFALITILERLKTPTFELHLNSLGCKKCRLRFKEDLKNFLKNYYNALCPDCQRRQRINPLRIFDCKVKECQNILKNAPIIVEYLCEDCKKHFEKVKFYLSLLNVQFILNPRLVRGLDYYTRTTFEIILPEIGAQNAVAGGGRYDDLVEELGGKHTPAIGFAIGLDRLLPYVPNLTKKRRPLFLALLGEEGIKIGLLWANVLRERNIVVEIDYRFGSLKSQLNRANHLDANWSIIIGEDEIKRGKAILRNMDTKEQINISVYPEKGLEQLLEWIKK